jgi:hypothetical protein
MPPPTVLLTTLAQLEAQDIVQPDGFANVLADFAKKHPDLDARLRLPDSPDLRTVSFGRLAYLSGA